MMGSGPWTIVLRKRAAVAQGGQIMSGRSFAAGRCGRSSQLYRKLTGPAAGALAGTLLFSLSCGQAMSQTIDLGDLSLNVYGFVMADAI